MKYNDLAILLIGVLPFHAMANDPNVLGHPSVTRVETNLGKGCRVSMSLPISERSRIGNGGDPDAGLGGFRVEPIPKGWKFKSFQKLYFNLMCLDADKVFTKTGEASFDPQTGSWKKDVERRIKSLGYKLSPLEYKDAYEDFDKAIRVYNVEAVNAKGFASTEDDTTGDEKNRVRHMGFCLINEPKALCGEGGVGYPTDSSKNDLTERVLEIIRTIEFLPDEE